MWDRWQRGGAEFDRSWFDRASSWVFPELAVTGGIRPAERSRSGRVLSLAEREEISRGRAASRSLRSIACDLSGFTSTISREARRNGGRTA
ncbi:helix-turn-helix domain-containing protein [Rhodobacteraceae bacterium 63075]|nr:helix-turn-helix domain-containing protein [Rhodobacteraceae bacterium 63075]